jgi:hypothetical protein
VADPFSKYLNVEEKNTLKGNSDPFSKYLDPNERTSSDFKLSNEDPPVDYTKPYEMPGEKDPFAKYLDKGYFGTGTQEDIDLGKKISNAFYLGFIDTARGLRQMSTANEDVLDKLRAEQKELYKDFDGPGGYLVAAAYFGGAILDPAGWLLPVTKGRTLYKMAKYGAINSGIAGALGYVDEESILDSRAKQAAASAVGGSILSPVIGAGVKKFKGEKIELGIPGFKDKTDIDISLKSAASNNLNKQQLFNEAGQNKRDILIRDKIDIQESERLKDLPNDKGSMLRGVRKFYKQFTDMWEERVGRPLYRQISKDEQITIPGTQIPVKGLSGAELGTGLAGGIYGYQTAEDDAPITTKLGRMGIGFLAGAGGIKATKKVSKTVQVKKEFGKNQEDETVEVTESLYDLLGRYFIDNYKMPANYKALQASAQGHAAHIASRFSDLAIKIQKNLTEDESKVLFNMLEGDNIFKVQTETLNNISKEARDLITEVAQEYVDMGILSPATFLRNKDTYLKRTYSKYKDDPREFGEELKLRGAYQKVTKQEYEDYYKDQVAFTTTSLREKPIFELEDVPGAKGKLKYLFEDVAGKKERLKGHRGWELLNTSEAQYAKLGPGDEVEIRWEFTKPQRVGLGEIEDAAFAIAETGRAFSSTLPQLKFYDNLAKEPYTYTKSQYAELSQELKNTLVKMPTTRIDPKNPASRFRYGNLADKYVPEEVYKDLLSTTKHYNTMGSGFWSKYKKLNSVWKVSKTAWNPTVHTNNIVSNVILHDLIDADFKYLPKAYKALMNYKQDESIIKNLVLGKEGQFDDRVSDLVRLAQKSGVFEADFVTKELGKIQELAIAMPYKYDGNAWNTGVTSASKVFEDIRKNNPLAKLTDWYRFEDHVFRLSVFQDRLAKGYTAAEAGLDARRAFIDYNINAPAINWMRQTATPFLAYTYRIVPLLAETAVVRPWKYLKYAAMGYGLNSMGEIVGGGDEKAERALMQEKQKGKFIFDFMPYREIKMPIPKFGDQPFEGPKYMNFTRFVPGGDIFDVGGNLFPYLPAPVQPNFGLMGEVLSSMLGFDLYGQRKLRGLGINDWEDVKVKGGDLLQDLTPNIPFFPGSYSTQRIDSARKGKESPYRAKETELEALFRSVGFKLETKSIDKLKTLKAAELNRKIKPIRENIRDLNNDLYKGLIDKEQYKKKLQYQKNLLKKIVSKYRTAFSVYEEKNYKQPIRIDEFTPLNIKEQTQKLFGKN